MHQFYKVNLLMLCICLTLFLLGTVQPDYRSAESNSKGKEALVLSSLDSASESESSSSRENKDIIAPLSSNLNKLKLDKHPIHNRKANSETQYQPEEWMLIDREPGTLQQLNLAIVRNLLLKSEFCLFNLLFILFLML